MKTSVSGNSRKKRRQHLPLLCLVAFVILCGEACRSHSFQSRWCDRQINIDGDDRDWWGALRYLEKWDISVGILNDEEHVYACLVSANREFRSRILRGGLIVWFDPRGGRGKDFGIRYPIGTSPESDDILIDEARAKNDEERKEVERRRREMMRASVEEVEFLGLYERRGRRVPVGTLEGIEIRIRYTEDVLVYEAKVAFTAEGPDAPPYVIRSAPGKKLGVGIVFPPADFDELRRSAGGGMRGPIVGGGVGGRRVVSGRAGMRQPLWMDNEIWLKVGLADPVEDPPR